eukprot:Unigene552_Nuclearia_a/m.1735 Unigene552_Nuclearia_a/g.1735  ORF Unigene552_Nuclearia_a/g.1735 Unigene552_Nuclearia_a/m.1735 type:complete len:368 (+) Unigene552_Nuclearia_a:31-1134(+)
MMYNNPLSVQETLAVRGAAQARDALGLVGLQRKLVVVRDLLTDGDVALGKEHDLLAVALDREHLGVAIGLAAVVDEARHVAHASCIDHMVVHPEQVRRPNPALLVAALAQVGHGRAHDLPDVLDHHVVLGDRLHRKEAPLVDLGPRKLEDLAARLQRVELEQVRIALVLNVAHEEAVLQARAARRRGCRRSVLLDHGHGRRRGRRLEGGGCLGGVRARGLGAVGARAGCGGDGGRRGGAAEHRCVRGRLLALGDVVQRAVEHALRRRVQRAPRRLLQKRQVLVVQLGQVARVLLARVVAVVGWPVRVDQREVVVLVGAVAVRNLDHLALPRLGPLGRRRCRLCRGHGCSSCGHDQDGAVVGRGASFP